MLASINKKGQLEMGITLMVIIIFMVILIASLILYFRFTYTQIEEDKSGILDQRYNSLLNVIIGLPEFRCSKAGIESECIDASKLSKFEDVARENNEYYQTIFGDTEEIWIEVIPENDYYNQNRYSIYGQPNGKGVIYSVPVSLYYPDYKKYKIGILKIKGIL